MAVQEERKYAIEAAIVRGMKMSRTMKMTELVHHVVQQLDYLFKAEPKYDMRRFRVSLAPFYGRTLRSCGGADTFENALLT